jgi:hypothetical protein
VENANRTNRIFQEQKNTTTAAQRNTGQTAANQSQDRGHTTRRECDQRVTNSTNQRKVGQPTQNIVRKDITPAGKSISSPAPRPTVRQTTTAPDRHNNVDMSTIKCYKCGQYGHYASYHDKTGMHNMKTGVVVESTEEVSIDQHNGDDNQDSEGNLIGKQYESAEEGPTEFDEYAFKEESPSDDDQVQLRAMWRIHVVSENPIEIISNYESDYESQLDQFRCVIWSLAMNCVCEWDQEAKHTS